VDATTLNYITTATGWPVVVLVHEVLDKHPRELYMNTENIIPLDVLVGSNSNEDSTFMGVAPEMYLQLAQFGLNKSVQTLVGSKYGPGVVDQVHDLYNGEENYAYDAVSAFAQFHGNWYIRCPSRAFASHAANLVSGNTPVQSCSS
jgi:carboxylesterase type B